jgi:hypothetical protein
MKFKNYILSLIFFCSVIYANAQTSKEFKEYTLTSNYQIDKTPSGNVKKSNRKVTIYIKDPMPITNVNSDFEQLPTGKLNIKIDGFETVENEIKYFGTFDFGDAKNQSFYGITKSYLGYTGVVFVKKKTIIDGKNFNYIVFMGEFDSEGDMPKVFTMYCCN